MADPVGDHSGGCQMFSPRDVSARASPHESQLMFRVQAVEVHASAPLRKRERDGLSAADAYESHCQRCTQYGAG